ncbi:LysR family transcriptional regulator [Sphingomonas sp. CARO-RG-8B-R24-01]|uniref:LysR family transcriptional regulator n=1 Tax=Sphingomonas sp. CARO-RG-8B-R24-01 TaxID=2914831 RepID=UPI002412C654|nr:LysR family transcriptional regulator [Sphingomonas sp. CARO-RG-8B-R24-01]
MQSPNWDDIRVFLAVARAGRLQAAGRLLGLDHSTVARRMGTLEAAIGARLIDRSPRGVVLTHAGEVLRDHAERIEVEMIGASAAVGADTGTVAGSVRLATPEAFGTYLVAPNVHRLHARHPTIELELAPESRSVSLSRREADIAIGLTRPPRGRLVARRLVDYRLGLYAAREYLAHHPTIDTVEAVKAHPLVWYIDELIDIPELRYFDQIVSDAPTVFRSSSIAAQQAAVANGLGIGVLHVFAAEQDSRLERVLPDLEVTRSYWLLMHADQQRLPRIRAVVDFLDEVVRINQHRF